MNNAPMTYLLTLNRLESLIVGRETRIRTKKCAKNMTKIYQKILTNECLTIVLTPSLEVPKDFKVGAFANKIRDEILTKV